MAKSKNQILKRMAQRHPIQIAVGLPKIVYENGIQYLQIEEGQKYDFQNERKSLYIGDTPKSYLEGHAFNYNPCVTGQRIYIEQISKLDVSKIMKKIEYRILTRVGWEK